MGEHFPQMVSAFKLFLYSTGLLNMATKRMGGGVMDELGRKEQGGGGGGGVGGGGSEGRGHTNKHKKKKKLS